LFLRAFYLQKELARNSRKKLEVKSAVDKRIKNLPDSLTQHQLQEKSKADV